MNFKNINRWIIFILIILFIFLFLHYRKYKQFNLDYEIEQQELDYVNGNELINQLNPLVITFIEEVTLEENALKYGLYSPLSFSKTYMNAPKEWYDENIYIKQKEDVFLIRPKKEIKIELVNPKYNNLFNKKDKNTYNLDKDNFNNVNTIEIIIREHNILYIPRHWLFKLIGNDECEVFYNSSFINKLLLV